MTNERPTLGRIVRAYAVAQVIAILIPLVLLLFGVDLGSATNIAGSFAAAMFAAHVFVKTYGRAPTDEERRRLAWLSLATGWAISLAMLGLLVALAGQAALGELAIMVQTLPSVVLFIVLVVISALYLGVFHVAYGRLARNLEKKLAIKRSEAG